MLKTRIFPLIALVSIFLLGACEHKATPAVDGESGATKQEKEDKDDVENEEE